jgi:integrase/recombinase XerD
MFESVFNLRAAQNHRLAPLLREREEFLIYLQRRGTGRGCLRVYASRLNQIVRFLKLKKIRRVRLREIENAARRWASYRGKYRHIPAGPWSEPSFVWLAKRWLRFLRKLILPCAKVAFADELREYAKFMESERGLSPSTVTGRMTQTCCFLRWFSKGRRNCSLSAISLNDVDRYFFVKAKQWSEVSLSSCASILRAFFVYAERRRWCRTGIALGIKGPIVRQSSCAPGGPRWREVLRLLRTTNGGTPVALRAKAILLLLCLYALRRGEIIRIQLGDFDWRNGLFTVRRSKRGGLQQFPLRREVTDSVLRYIRSARPPCSCKNLFVSFHPPFGPIHPTSINEIVTSRLNRLGIKARRRGPHSLRHACATELLRRGIPLREIADFLGHRTCQSVAIYAKFDMESLRNISNLNLTGKL